MTARAAYDTLLGLAGVAAGRAPLFAHADPVLATPFRAGEAAAAALGLSAATAGEMWRLRGGAPQEISVDVRAAAASLIGSTLLRRDGQALAPPFADNPAVGFYQTADGHWIHLHGGFPHLAERTLALLNAEHTRDSVAEACTRWNAFALEDALAYMGLSGTVARTEAEWRASPQGKAMGAAPPILVTRIGDAPRLSLPHAATPYANLRVLDLTCVLAGPVAARTLASYGADTLTIHNPASPAIEAFAIETGHGKRVAYLDLKRPAEAEALRGLAHSAHVFVQNYRPGALARLGFSPPALAQLAPGIVYVSVSGFGHDGPWAERRCWDELAQTVTGIALDQGAFEHSREGRRRDTEPMLLPGAVCGYVTGYLAAAGAGAALLRRMREGGSWLVQVSLTATATWLQSLGRVEPGLVPARAAPFSTLDEWFASCETKGGRLVHLKPAARMSRTPPGWDRAPSEASDNTPAWSTR